MAEGLIRHIICANEARARCFFSARSAFGAVLYPHLERGAVICGQAEHETFEMMTVSQTKKMPAVASALYNLGVAQFSGNWPQGI